MTLPRDRISTSILGIGYHLCAGTMNLMRSAVFRFEFEFELELLSGFLMFDFCLGFPDSLVSSYHMQIVNVEQTNVCHDLIDV